MKKTDTEIHEAHGRKKHRQRNALAKVDAPAGVVQPGPLVGVPVVDARITKKDGVYRDADAALRESEWALNSASGAFRAKPTSENLGKLAAVLADYRTAFYWRNDALDALKATIETCHKEKIAHDANNARRLALLEINRKRFLTPDEVDELVRLTAIVDAHVSAAHPLPKLIGSEIAGSLTKLDDADKVAALVLHLQNTGERLATENAELRAQVIQLEEQNKLNVAAAVASPLAEVAPDEASRAFVEAALIEIDTAKATKN